MTHVDSDEVSRRSRTLSTDSHLIEGVRCRDPLFWQRFVRLYSPLIYHWCRRAGLRADDSADVMQEVFRSVFTGIPRFQSVRATDTFRGWLWTITRNKLRDLYRRRRGQPEAGAITEGRLTLNELAIWTDRTEDPSESAEGTAILFQRALAELKIEFEDRTWEAFWRTAVEGHVPADVAQSLGISVNAVYKARSRVLSRLRQYFGQHL